MKTMIIKHKYNEPNILPPSFSYTKPQILTHPNIPKPLHGINPREIMGTNWWNKKRQEVYASTNYHCIACGVNKLKAKKHKWLEAHEFWRINYETGVCEITSIEPLCHYCHNFIHSGRLSMIMDKDKSKQEVIEILEHGFKILAENNLKCFSFTKEFACEIGARTFNVNPSEIIYNPLVRWNDWILRWEGNEYKSRFKSEEEWKEFYSRAND